MTIRPLTVAALFIATTSAVTGEQPGLKSERGRYLKPAESQLSDYGFMAARHAKIREVLLQNSLGHPLVRVVVLPDPRPAYVVAVEVNAGSYRIVHRAASHPIGGSHDPSKIQVAEKAQNLSKDLALLLNQIFLAASKQTRYGDDQLELHGVSYYFSAFAVGVGIRAGCTWSPPAESNCGRLVALTELLVNYTSAGIFQRGEIAEKIEISAKRLFADLERLP